MATSWDDYKKKKNTGSTVKTTSWEEHKNGAGAQQYLNEYHQATASIANQKRLETVKTQQAETRRESTAGVSRLAERYSDSISGTAGIASIKKRIDDIDKSFLDRGNSSYSQSIPNSALRTERDFLSSARDTILSDAKKKWDDAKSKIDINLRSSDYNKARQDEQEKKSIYQYLYASLIGGDIDQAKKEYEDALYRAQNDFSIDPAVGDRLAKEVEDKQFVFETLRDYMGAAEVEQKRLVMESAQMRHAKAYADWTDASINGADETPFIEEASKADEEYQRIKAEYEKLYHDVYGNASYKEYIANAAFTGLGAQSVKFIFSAANLLADVIPGNTGVGDAIRQGNNASSDWLDRVSYSTASSTRAMGESFLWQAGADLITTMTNMIPHIVLAYMTGGASDAVSAAEVTKINAQKGAKKLLSVCGNVAKTWMKDPSFWLTFAQEAGMDYEKAKEQGASDARAAAYGFLTGSVNAGIEVGLDGLSGIQGLPKMLVSAADSGNDAFVKAIIKTALSEGKEEVFQDLVEGINTAIIYGRNPEVTMFSWDDEEAAFNPLRTAKAGVMGFIAGGAMAAPALAGNRIAYNLSVRENDAAIANYVKSIDGVQGIVETGLESPEGTESRAIAEKLRQRASNPENLTNAEIASQYRANIAQIEAETVEEIARQGEEEAQNRAAVSAEMESDLKSIGVDEGHAKEIISLYDKDSGLEPVNYVIAADEAYRAGRNQAPLNDLFAKTSLSKLSRDQILQVYSMGQELGDIRADEAQNTKITPNKEFTPAKGFKKISFDGNVNLNVDDGGKRIAELRFIDTMASIGRTTVHVYESYKNADGQTVYKDSEGVEQIAQYGMYRGNTDEIWVDLNDENGEHAAAMTFTHEMTHHIQRVDPVGYRIFSSRVAEAYGTKASVDAAVNAQIVNARNAGFGEEWIMKTRGVSEGEAYNVLYDTAYADFIADACDQMMTKGNFSEVISSVENERPGFIQKVKKWLDRVVANLRKFYDSIKGQSAAGYILTQTERFEDLQKEFARLLVSSGEKARALRTNADGENAVSDIVGNAKPSPSNAIITDGIYVTDDSGKQWSLRSMKEDIAEGKMFEDLQNVCGWKDDQVTRLRENLNALVKMISSFSYQDVNGNTVYALDINEQYGKNGRRFSVYKKNSDPLYKYSLDFSTQCAKRILVQKVIEQLQVRLEEPLTAEQSLAVRDMLLAYKKYDSDLEVSCAMCYVESARLKSPAQMLKWFVGMPDAMRTYFVRTYHKKDIDALEEDFKERHGFDRKATQSEIGKELTKQMKDNTFAFIRKYPLNERESSLIERAKSLPRTTFLTAQNLANLYADEETRDIYKAYAKFIQNATHSKMVETDEAYWYGDSEALSDGFIGNMRRENGVRFDSWSDWRVEHLLDYITAIIDLSVRGASMHGYTKFPELAYVLGKTGAMLNMSGVPGTKNGLNEDGTLSFSGTESVNKERALKARDDFPDTVAMQCIGVSHEHIVKLMDSGEIDYIIPYHISGLNKSLRSLVGIGGWFNYEPYQNEKVDDSISKSDTTDNDNWHKHPAFSEWFVGYDTGMTGIEAMRQSAENYKELCKKRGLLPKFAQIPEIYNHENYWKVLIDRKMINQFTGELIEQKPVVADFNFEDDGDIEGIFSIVKRYGDNYKKTESATQRAIDTIMANLDEMNGRAAKKNLAKRIRAMRKGKLAEPIAILGSVPISAAPRGIDASGRVKNSVATNVETGLEAEFVQHSVRTPSADSGDVFDEYVQYSYRGKKSSAIYIKDGHTKEGDAVSFVDLILDRKKKGETRVHNRLTRKWVGIAKDGYVYGRVRLGDPYLIDNATQEYKDSYIEGTEYDIKDGEQKYYYPIVDVDDFRGNPIPIERNGNYGTYTDTTDNDDIRYSLRNPLRQEVEKESAALEDVVKEFRSVISVSGKLADVTATKNVATSAQNIMDRYNADGDVKEFTSILRQFYVDVLNDDVSATWDSIMEQANAAVKWIAKNSKDESALFDVDSSDYGQSVALSLYESLWASVYGTLSERYNRLTDETRTLKRDYVETVMDKNVSQLRAGFAQYVKDTKKFSRDERTITRLQKKIDYINRQLEVARNSRSRIIQMNRESRETAAEKRRKTIIRNKIQRVTDDLNSMLLHGNKKKHIPEGLRSPVAKALGIINMDTIGAEKRVAHYDNDLIPYATDPADINRLFTARDRIEAQGERLSTALAELKVAYDAIQSDQDSNIRSIYDSVISAQIQKTFDDVGNTSLREMTEEQLDEVYKMFRMVRKAVTNENRMFYENKRYTVETLSSMAMSEIEQHGVGKTIDPKSIANTVNRYGWNYLKPYVAMKVIGSDTLSALYERIRAGEGVWYEDVNDAAEFYRGKRKQYNASDWNDEETVEFTDANGKKFRLNLGQRMSLYAYIRRDYARRHLETGGFVYDGASIMGENGKKYVPSTVVNYIFNKDVEDAITESLSKDQRNYVEDMQKYLSETMGEKGNEVSMQLYDVKLFREMAYFPMRTSDRQREIVYETSQRGASIKNYGFTNEPIPSANNSLVLSNFNDTWANHVNQMSNYHAFVLPLDDFTRVFNYETHGDGAATGVRSSIYTEFGTRNAENYVAQLLRDINGGVRVEDRVGVGGAMTALMKRSRTMASLSVTIQQISSIARAAALIDPKYFTGKRVSVDRAQRSWDQIIKYAPIAGIKQLGYFDIGMGRSTASIITEEQPGTIKEKAKAFFAKDGSYRDEVFTFLPNFMDQVGWTIIWDAVKREVAGRSVHPEINSEEFLRVCGKRFEEVIQYTQVYDSVFSRNSMMRDGNTFSKMVTAFMAEPTTTANMVILSTVESKRSGNAKPLARTLASVVASVIFNSVLVALPYAMRDKDKEKTFGEKYVSALVENTVDNLNPVTYFPYLRDIWNIVEGYDVERADLDMISDLLMSLRNIATMIGKIESGSVDEEEGKKALVDYAIDALAMLPDFTGIPVTNIVREVRAGINTIQTVSRKSEIPTSAGLWNAVRESLPFQQSISNKQQLYEAMVSGNQKQIDRVSARYKDESSLNTAIQGALKQHDPRIREAAQANVDGDLERYDEILNEIVGEGHFARNRVIGALNSMINELKPDEEETTTYTDKAKAAYTVEQYVNALADGDPMATIIRDDIISAKVANGKNQNDAEDALLSDTISKIGVMYRDGSITEVRAMELLEANAYMDENEAYLKLKAWSSDDGTTNVYNELDKALWSNKSVLSAKKDLVDHGYTDATVSNHMVETVKKMYWGEKKGYGRLSKESAIKRLTTYADMSASDAEQIVKEWTAYVVTGHDYDNVRADYIDGKIDKQTARNILKTYGGYVDADIDNEIRAYDWQIEFMNKTPVGTGLIRNYYTYVEETGVTREQFNDFAINCNGKKKEEVVEYISGTNLSPKQKDELYLTLGFAKSGLPDMPWN